jgi:hypothetical protein
MYVPLRPRGICIDSLQINQFKDAVESQEKEGSATEVVASSFEPNLVCCRFNSVSGLDRWFSRQLRKQADIKLATV